VKIKFEERKDTPRLSGDSVKEILLKADMFRDCAVIAQALVDIMKEQDISLTDFEKIYRDRGSDTYLLAAPKEMLPPNQSAVNLETLEEKPYWLWICVNGEEEAKATMAKFKIKGYKDNIDMLSKTGFILQK